VFVWAWACVGVARGGLAAVVLLPVLLCALRQGHGGQTTECSEAQAGTQNHGSLSALVCGVQSYVLSRALTALEGAVPLFQGQWGAPLWAPGLA